MITRTLISLASIVSLLFVSVSPAFAYVRSVPPHPTTVMRQRSELRELYADAFSSILALSSRMRAPATSDLSGRSKLARAQTRTAQRNFRRSILGYLRGSDYRILNVSGDMRRQGTTRTANIPSTLVRTGYQDQYNRNRPARRKIRGGENDQGGAYGVEARDRLDMLKFR